MISRALLTVFFSSGLLVFAFGLQSALLFPLALWFAARERRVVRSLAPFAGKVTVLVPAYDEERTIRAAVDSILASDYPDKEVIVIDDGSTDGTAEQLRDLAQAGRIRLLRKRNGGKASALNAGLRAATGDVIVCTDADSVFLRDTLRHVTRWFGDAGIDAVCGSDGPLGTRTALQRFLATTTHIGTGFVRRGLSVIGCLPIVSGSLGAFRARVLRDLGGYRNIWGEDLELTLRLQRSRRRIVFDPEAKVLAECPATLPALWRQRVRWVRSYIRIVLAERRGFFRPSRWPFSFYLPLNFVSMAVVPVLQLALLVALPAALRAHTIRFDGALEVAAYGGLPFFVVIAVCGILLDRELGDLRHLPYGLLIVLMSQFFNVVVVYSWWKEAGGAAQTWHKTERRGPAAQRAVAPGGSASGHAR